MHTLYCKICYQPWRNAKENKVHGSCLELRHSGLCRAQYFRKEKDTKCIFMNLLYRKLISF